MPLSFFNVHISLRQIIEKIKRKINFQTANKIKEFHLMIEIIGDPYTYQK